MKKHLLLFVITLVTTTLAGTEWTLGKGIFLDPPHRMQWADFWQGLWFSVPFLGILTAHEFGHYWVAKWHRVRATLPYYIPAWLGGFIPMFGTMGAVIRLLESPRSRKAFFDIGIAGPLAGFVVAMGLLWYGFTHLPTLDYLYQIHPEYRQHGLNFNQPFYQLQRQGQFALGDNLVFWFFKTYVADPTRLPPAFEMYHYPFLFAGYLSLFFTALNLLPIGQLDGGHILYGLVGKKTYNILSPSIFVAFSLFAGLGFFTYEKFQNPDTYFGGNWGLLGSLGLYIFFLQMCYKGIAPEQPTLVWILAVGTILVQLAISALTNYEGFDGGFLFLFLLGRYMGVYHQPVADDTPLDWKRQLLGWFALVVFVICVSPHPFSE
jgi:membrane-associated protease RseP (regulator of RpoE activity)